MRKLTKKILSSTGMVVGLLLVAYRVRNAWVHSGTGLGLGSSLLMRLQSWTLAAPGAVAYLRRRPGSGNIQSTTVWGE